MNCKFHANIPPSSHTLCTPSFPKIVLLQTSLKRASPATKRPRDAPDSFAVRAPSAASGLPPLALPPDVEVVWVDVEVVDGVVVGVVEPPLPPLPPVGPRIGVKETAGVVAPNVSELTGVLKAALV
jgi:hypothetical protein